nr:zinc finger MYM-type protein 1-like [Hydra vulgaris]
MEALINCRANKFSSLLCLIALSSGKLLTAGKDDSILLDMVNKVFCPILFFKPHQEWGNAVCDYRKHEESCVLDEKFMLSFNTLLSRCNSKSNVIEVDLNNSCLKLLSDNRKKLVLIIKTIIFLGRNDLAFRSYRDDNKYYPDIGESSTQKVLKNATYISKTTQNQLIDSCGKAIEEVLIKNVKHSIFYSILCDKAVDCSNTEQMSLVLRYVNSNNEICEDFLRLIDCKTGTSGLSLSLNVLNALQEFGLDIQNCRGQGYDDAGCMAGEYKAVVSRIKALNHKAIFVHCASHRLSIVVAAAFQV